MNAHVLNTAFETLQENGIKADREMTLTLEGKKLTALHVYDYSTGFNDTFAKVRELLPFVSVKQSYSHKILIQAV